MEKTETNLLKKFAEVERLAKGSRWTRLGSHPIKYLCAQVHRYLFYKWSGIPLPAKTKTFWGRRFHVLLPSAMDIFLTGGKTHDSELRLTKYILKNLGGTRIVFDIGAHFGFYTLLMAEVARGRVYSFEASPRSFKILFRNIDEQQNVFPNHIIISDQSTPMDFYEYPALYSEFNTIEHGRNMNEEWTRKSEVSISEVASATLDQFCMEKNIIPEFMKLDVEGAENRVLTGGAEILQANNIIIAMEYLNCDRNNYNHIMAAKTLERMHYFPFCIDQDGNLDRIIDMGEYMNHLALDSDMIIFRKGIFNNQ